MKNRDFKVYAGYYEYNVYMDGEYLCSIGDPTETLCDVKNKTELKMVCYEFIEAEILGQLYEQDIELELTKTEQNSILKQLCNLFIAHCDFENAKKLEVA